MKNDPLFKYVAVICIVGAFIALSGANRPLPKAGNPMAAGVEQVAQAPEQSE